MVIILILCLKSLLGMFSPLIMSLKAYLELVNSYVMPLPIPKPQDMLRSNLHYVSFEEAVMQPFSDEHQPSLKIRRREENLSRDVALGSRDTRATEAEQNKLTQSNFTRGVVKCKDCMKPRCLYSVTSPSMIKPASMNASPEPTVQEIRSCREK